MLGRVDPRAVDQDTRIATLEQAECARHAIDAAQQQVLAAVDYGLECEVLGPEDLSHDDIAAVVFEALRTPVRYQQIPGQALTNQLTGNGVSDAMAQGMLDMMIAKDNGLDNGIVRTPRNAIDTPTTFRQWCQDTLEPAVRVAWDRSHDATGATELGPPDQAAPVRAEVTASVT